MSSHLTIQMKCGNSSHGVLGRLKWEGGSMTTTSRSVSIRYFFQESVRNICTKSIPTESWWANETWSMT